MKTLVLATIISSLVAFNVSASDQPQIVDCTHMALIEETASLYVNKENLTLHYRNLLESHCNHNSAVLHQFDKMADKWLRYYNKHTGAFDIDTLLQATVFAAIKHEGQVRKDAESTPYIIHPIGVAYILWTEGNIRNVNVLTAALLHDTLEDTETTAEEIESLFGSRVRSTVEEVTNDPALSSEENKQRQVDHAPNMSMDAQLVKLADRLYNIRDLKNAAGWDE
jgi:(p)ppGpp synthase/HD superfamily hydrolase